MGMMAKALLIIDYTNDFVADKGALTCGASGQAIADSIVGLAHTFLKEGQWIILPTDLHVKGDPYHPETKLFPPHNLKDSWGRGLYGSLDEWYRLNKSSDHVYFMDKNRYSAFANTNLENYLRSRGIDELWLTGVCTDICVLHTAVDAYNKNFRLVVPRNAVASFSQSGHEWALNHFRTCLGASVVDA
jgi:nicotinamidase-related amidase